MRWLLATVLVIAAAACSPHAKLPQGPQPYLIVKVFNPDNTLGLAGTIASDITFEYSGESPDHQDGFEFRGSLVENTSSGFRIHWHAVRRAHGREVRSIDKEEFAPWGVETKLESIADHRVSVFYAPRPANKYFAREDFTK